VFSLNRMVGDYARVYDELIYWDLSDVFVKPNRRFPA